MASIPYRRDRILVGTKPVNQIIRITLRGNFTDGAKELAIARDIKLAVFEEMLSE